jgi:hypothetical protein
MLARALRPSIITVVANLFIGSAKLHYLLIILLHATLTTSTNVYVEVMSIPLPISSRALRILYVYSPLGLGLI